MEQQPRRPTMNSRRFPPKQVKEGLVASPDTLEEFHCNLCQCLLTVSPIRLVENSYVCGRCPGEGMRQLPLEKLASRFYFPCRYVQGGCKKNLPWAEVDDHEKICCHQPANCTIENCEWKGSRTTLVDHFRSTHASYVLTENDSIKLSETLLANYFYFIGKDTAFEIEIENAQDQITHKVTLLWTKLDASKYAYKITLLNKEVNVVLFHDLFGAPGRIDTKAIKSLADNFEELQVHFKINVTESVRGFYDVCAYCPSPITKNVYVASCGHSVCEKCTKQGQYCKCPSQKCLRARQEFCFPKNYALEKLIDSFRINLKGEITPTNSAEEEVPPTNSVKEEAPPTNPVKEEVTPANPVKKEDLPKNPVKEETPSTNPLKEEVPPTTPVKEEVPSKNPVKEEVPPTNFVKEEVPPKDPVKEEVSSTNPVKEEVAPKDPVKEEVPSTNPVKEEVPPTNLVKEDVPPTNPK